MKVATVLRDIPPIYEGREMSTTCINNRIQGRKAASPYTDCIVTDRIKNMAQEKNHIPFLDGPDVARTGMVVTNRAESRLSKLTPTAEMRRAKGKLEAIGRPPAEDRELLASHGWLSPEGNLYACGYKDHDTLCRLLGFERESAIENAGYCKLSNLEWLVSPRFCARELTEAQWETIERWYSRNNFSEAHFVRLGTGV